MKMPEDFGVGEPERKPPKEKLLTLTTIPNKVLLSLEELLPYINPSLNPLKATEIRSRVRTGVYDILFEGAPLVRTIEKKVVVVNGNKVLLKGRSPFIRCPRSEHEEKSQIRFTSGGFPHKSRRIRSYISFLDVPKSFFFDRETCTLTVYQESKVHEPASLEKNSVGRWATIGEVLQMEHIPKHEKEYLERILKKR